MADGDGAGGAGAAALAGGEGGGAGGAGETGGGGAAAPEWLGGLPEDIRGDATLSRYKSVDELARGHIEAHKLAKSKLSVPGADAKPEAWGAVFDALGRPKEAAAYEIPLPQGVEKSPMADAFRPVAHQLGLLPAQAKGIAEFFNGQSAAAEKAFLDEGAAQVAALKEEMGAEFEPQLSAARGIAAKLGFDSEFIDALDKTAGSGALVKGFMKLAKLTGEQPLVEGDAGGGFGAGLANAEGQLMAKFKDAGWRDKLNKGDVATKAEHDRLLAAAKAQAARAGGG